MDRKNNILRQTPFADATNTKNGDQQVGPLHELVATPGNNDANLMSFLKFYMF
jgi:hypothetical protein